MRYGAVILALLATPAPASGHWSIVSELTAAEPGRAFQLRLHYEIMAGQPNPDEPLKVCFWIERHQGNRYAEVTRRACQPVTLKPNDWLTLTFSADTLPRATGLPAGPLPAGQYRAVALIQSDVNPIVRFFVGAAQDRKVLPFQVD